MERQRLERRRVVEGVLDSARGDAPRTRFMIAAVKLWASQA
jgi:hypothetical protein